MTSHLTKATSMDAFLVPQPTDSDADAPSDATEPTDSNGAEHAAEREEDGDATDRDEDGDAAEDAENGAATEHATNPTDPGVSALALVCLSNATCFRAVDCGFRLLFH